MAYTADKPKLVPPSEELRARIPGWGADLDPKDRPAVPKEQLDLAATGAHWTFPERQVPAVFREKSTEHKFLTPAFGTVCPLKGVSGLIRRYAYTFSEGRAAHWLLLVLADRIDVIESRIGALFRLKPDNPIKEMGLKAELTRHPIASRKGRSDVRHLPVDVLMFAGTTAATVAAGVFLARGVSKVVSALL